MKLRRVKAGHYITIDGRFEIIKDPTSGDEPGGWGFRSWLLFDNEDPSCEAMCWNNTNQHHSLRAAHESLEDYIRCNAKRF